ncbi:MAG: alpha-hydroxy-acid oxidizing protein, partial [Lachnospiraceae bacterium]|nr:alpha-hydroxy-acid oxidizing protein [Lachnospiraceae bacterium]
TIPISDLLVKVLSKYNLKLGYLFLKPDGSFINQSTINSHVKKVCKNAGIDGIVISHHHGRLPFAVPPLMVLSEIKAVSGDMKIFVDCSMDDGRDVYKAMALGADAVSVGRGILPGLIKEGKDGVIKKVSRINEELRELMGYTGVKNVSEFDPAVLWYHGRHFTDNN